MPEETIKTGNDPADSAHGVGQVRPITSDEEERARSTREATIAGQVLVWDLDGIEAEKTTNPVPQQTEGGRDVVDSAKQEKEVPKRPEFANLDAVPVKGVPAMTISRQNQRADSSEGQPPSDAEKRPVVKTESGPPASGAPANRTAESGTGKGKADPPAAAPPGAGQETPEDIEARRRKAVKRKIARKVAKEEVHFPLNSPDSQARKSTRTRRVLARLFWMLLFLAYAAAVLGYFGILAKDRFVSRAVFVVTRGGSDAATATSISLVSGSNPASQDAYAAIAYIRSVDMLRFLEMQGFDLRGHFSQSDRDFIYHLEENAPLEDFLDYYRERVTAYFNDVEGIVTLEVEGFDQEYAQRLAAAILGQAEDNLNELNREIAQQQMKFVLEDLELSEQRLQDTRNLLLGFQNRNLIIDPQADIESRLELIQEIKKEMVFLQAEKIKLIAQSPNSPRIQEIEATIEGLNVEIEREGRDLTGDDPEQLNQLLSEFSEINQKLEFALERYRQSLAVAEEIRIKSLEQNRFLSVIEQPFIPEDSIRPQRGYLAASFLILGFMGLQILRLGVRTVMEH